MASKNQARALSDRTNDDFSVPRAGRSQKPSSPSCAASLPHDSEQKSVTSNISSVPEEASLAAAKKKKKKNKAASKAPDAASVDSVVAVLVNTPDDEENVALSLGLVPLSGSAVVDVVVVAPAPAAAVMNDATQAPIWPYPPTPPPGRKQDGDSESSPSGTADSAPPPAAAAAAESDDNNDFVVVDWKKYDVSADETPTKDRLAKGELPGPFISGNELSVRRSPPRNPPTASSSSSFSPSAPETPDVPSVSRRGASSLFDDEPSVFNERTPMAHIRHGSLAREDEKTEIDTPSEASVVNDMCGGRYARKSQSSSSDETHESDDNFSSSLDSAAAAAAAKRISDDDEYSQWAAYDHVIFHTVPAGPAKAVNLKANEWRCDTCTLVNAKEFAWVCEACGTARKKAAAKAEQKAAAKAEQQEEEDAKKGTEAGSKKVPIQRRQSSWGCKACSFENEVIGAKCCEVCETARDIDETTFEMTIEVPILPQGKKKAEGNSPTNDKGGSTKAPAANNNSNTVDKSGGLVGWFKKNVFGAK